MSKPSLDSFCWPSNLGRSQHSRSWSFITTLASFGEETTITRLKPNWRENKEPYFFENCHSCMWREEISSWWRFPTMGRPLEPGGNGGLLKVVKYLKKNGKNKGKIRQRIRRSDENIVYTTRKRMLDW